MKIVDLLYIFELNFSDSMNAKPWLHPAPSYRTLETYWDTDEDAPGPRCGHTLTAVAATKTTGPRLILFGGATAIEGGATSSAPGISYIPLILFVFDFSCTHTHTPTPTPALLCIRTEKRTLLIFVLGLAGVTNSVHLYDVLTRKWTRFVGIYCSKFEFLVFSCILIYISAGVCRIRPAGEPPSPRAAHAAAAVGTMVVFQVINGNFCL